MKKVALYSSLLLLGLVLSQILPLELGESYDTIYEVLQALTMVALAYIMVQVGREFDIDKTNLRQYGWDYVVAATAAAFPWIFCCLYFVFILVPAAHHDSWGVWKESLLASRFSAPTSAGVLFSMLAAAGLAATWVFKKARILAIFDDLDTVLLMIPLKMAMVGMRWQLAVIVIWMALMLWIAFKYLHRVRIPSTWPWVLGYSVVMVVIIEAVYFGSKRIDPAVPIHIEVLLPAFVLGCIMTHGYGGGRKDEAGHSRSVQDGPLEHGPPSEDRVGSIISAAFMLLVGLSMPNVAGEMGGAATQAVDDAATHVKATSEAVGQYLRDVTPAMTWGQIALHTVILTAIANLGKMFPAFCYRKEATLRERLAVSVAMWPRGEVGAGVLVVSLGYGIGGPIVVIAMLSLALNLVLTGVFILIVKKLIGFKEPGSPTGTSTAAAH